MLGVVLWSDENDNKAVIWCEDHRNLAFFRQEDGCGQEAAPFAPGDLVEFDLREENNLRLAIDPCVVAPHEYPSLASDLKSASAGLRRKTGLPVEPVTPDCRVVRLRPARQATRKTNPVVCASS